MNKRINDWINWVLYDELIAGKLNAPICWVFMNMGKDRSSQPIVHMRWK